MSSTTLTTSSQRAREALYPYRVRCAGLEYVALAASACAAIADAITLHGVAGASAQPFAKTGARK